MSRNDARTQTTLALFDDSARETSVAFVPFLPRLDSTIEDATLNFESLLDFRQKCLLCLRTEPPEKKECMRCVQKDIHAFAVDSVLIDEKKLCSSYKIN